MVSLSINIHYSFQYVIISWNIQWTYGKEPQPEIIILHSLFIQYYTYFWVNYDKSLTWILRPWMGMILRKKTKNMIPVRENRELGRSNSPRYLYINNWLVVFRPTPLKNYESVSWDVIPFPIWWDKSSRCSEPPTSYTLPSSKFT